MENTITTETRFRLLRPPGGGIFWLAAVATATALSLSILAGWQRGGTLPERVVWVAIGIMLVVSAHLLPALIRESSFVVRGVGSMLWFACMVTAGYGHLTFFLFAQQHAGERRASVVAITLPAPAHSLTVVMADRATVVRQLAWLDARRCFHDCAGRDARRATLAARLDALNAEADDVRRQQATDDRVTAQRGVLLADPVTSRLAALLGISTSRVDLLSGLMPAAVLEGVACLLWTILLRPSSLPTATAVVTDTTSTAATPPQEPSGDATHLSLPAATPIANVTTVTRPAVTVVAASHADGTESSEALSESRAVMENSRAPRDDPITPVPDGTPPGGEVAELAQAIAAGQVRPTVSGIRTYLGCSQARAAALRRQLVEHTTTA
ncbi:hypothetical protein [Burkholderia pseudomallei]|uniref:hypothetical protein n=1 Tax=Burkholderia pseudomallei TaxID=28450 RepID=UPI00016B1D90|nr:hypothetical protein [Burkholderia pseudomallei]AGZ29747.1 putative membrane protein [Burkholderia pseudomallei NCTC 13179]